MSRGGDPGGRVVVVSPHLDDGILSLGAAIASWVRAGRSVVVLTVLACDPQSGDAAGGWDVRAGFATEGAAARARRAEDRAACDRLGAAAIWLPFGSGDYDRHADDADIHRAVASAVSGAAAVLLPGSPLSQAEHAWLTGLLLERSLPCERLGFYAEQPYRDRTAEPPTAPDWLSSAVDSELAFEGIRVDRRARLAKLRAVRHYRSQLGLLALDRRGGWPLYRLLWSEARRGGEALAWTSARRPAVGRS